MAKQEEFADGFVDYLRTGKAPSEGLMKLFEQCAKFVAGIFRGLQGHVELSDDVKNVYDSLLKDDGTGLSKAMRAVDEQQRKSNLESLYETESVVAEQDAEKVQAENSPNAQKQASAVKAEKVKSSNDVDSVVESPSTTTTAEQKQNAVYNYAGQRYASMLQDNNGLKSRWSTGPDGENLLDGKPAMLFQSANAEEKIEELLKDENLKSGKKVSEEIGDVSETLAENAERYGYDIRGYKHTIDNYSIIHAINSHGNTAKEKSRGQIAITNEDFRRIPDVLSSPDYIVYGSVNKKGLNCITYAKNLSDGTTLYIEEQRKGKKELATNSIYKMPGASDAYTLSRNPTLYAQNETGSIHIVDVKREIVNPENLFQKEERSQIDDVRKLYEGTEQWMKAPNGKDTNFTERQWLQARTPNFKKWFGGWEADLNTSVSDVAGVKAILESLRKEKLHNITFNTDGIITRDGRDKLLSGKAINKSVNSSVHFAATANIKKLFANVTERYVEDGKNNENQVYKYFCPFKFNRESYLAKITVKDYQDNLGNRIYSLEAMDVENIKKTQNGILGSNIPDKQGETPHSVSISRLDQLFYSVNDVSKVVDKIAYE